MKKKLARILAFALTAVMLATQLPYVLAADADYCSVCGENGVKGALQHTIAATCGKDGFKIYDCSNGGCKGTITVKVPATGIHTPDGNTVAAVPATCTEKGTKAYQRCTGCGCYLEPGTHSKLESIVIPATGHSYTDVVTAPTCTEKGYTTHTCSVCGDSYVDTKVAALGHNFSVTVPAKPATCKEEGYTEYKVCSRCGAEDPNHPKVVVPVQNHSLALIDHQNPTCVADGYNKFKCDEPTCPYYNVITEVIPATGHDLVNHAAKTATCTEGGYGEYKTCKNCDYNTYDPSTATAPLGHTYVSKGYIAPECTKEGCTDAIVCDRCGYIHHQGESIAPSGHNLVDVAAVPATCTEKGAIAHKKCTACEKLFATTVENDDIDAQPLSSVETSALGHKYTTIVIDSTCTEGGYKVHTCDVCNHTYSEPIAAKGHKLTDVAQVPATCAHGGATGTKAHKKCSVCNKLFATTATGKVNDVEISAASLVIPAPAHVAETVDALNPTYDAAGHTAGTKCKNCGESLVGATPLDELKEAVKFHYELVGVNGAANAVNSGYVTLKIYFDVLKDTANDLDIYKSDVLANIFAVDFAMSYDARVFKLTDVLVAPGAFDNAAFTPVPTANNVGTIVIAQDMKEVEGKVFRGENNLFATLTFQVNPDAVATNYVFDVDNILVVHPETDEATVDATTSDASVAIDVKALGDANGDSVFNSADSLKIGTYIDKADEDTDYVAEYDMNKDGVIDFIDLDLLRKAIVGNTEYLDITVNPNAITPEV